MATFKEIVTKAVIGKGKKAFKNTYNITTEVEPTTILGCWVINHKFKGYETGNRIVVDGSFDVNMWYSHDSDSKTSVVSRKIDYSEAVSIKTKTDTDLGSDKEIIVRALKQPTCSRVETRKDIIEFDIEKELGIEIVGDTKVKISVEEKEEPWDVIEDEEVTPEVEKQIEASVTETVIKDSVNK